MMAISTHKVFAALGINF